MNYLRLFTFVPERHVYIIERLGRFNRQLNPGFNWLVPFFDKVSYRHSIKEEAIKIEKQTAITQDNVSLNIDGVLFVKIFDPLKASYQVENPLEAVKLLALTLMRSEIGKLRLDKLFQEREELNKAINYGVNSAAEIWGISCLRYEILNIDPPEDIKKSMQSEAEAERLKRKDILLSEAKKISEINIATGKNKAAILNAEGDAESVNVITDKESEAIAMISNAIAHGKGKEVINYILLQNYLRDYENTLKKGKVTVAPTGKGTSGGNNDLTTLAAMLLAGQMRPSSSRPAEESSYSPRSTSRSESTSELYDEPSQDEYLQLAKKMRVYDNPVLYSSDDEALKKAIDNKQQQGNQMFQQFQQNIQGKL
jgi:regulator of protease activity HflC (stomatin/prohibitin superfamily)